MRFSLILLGLFLAAPAFGQDAIDLSGFYDETPPITADLSGFGEVAPVADPGFVPIGDVDLSGFYELAKTPWVRPARAVILTGDPWCKPCVDIKPRLDRAIEALKKQGWTIGPETSNMIQVIYLPENFSDDDLPADLPNKSEVTLPYFAKLEEGKVVRRWKPSDGPLDAFEISWLFSGKRQRTVTDPPAPPADADAPTVTLDAQYPTHGGAHWGVAGTYNPSTENLRTHLAQGQHGYDPDWLAQLSREELLSLHDDDHTGRVQSRYVNKPVEVRDGSQMVVRPAPQYYRQTYRYCPSCGNND